MYDIVQCLKYNLACPNIGERYEPNGSIPNVMLQMRMFPSPAQIRAARAMLDWSLIDLSKAASVSVAVALNAEGGNPERISERTRGAIAAALRSERPVVSEEASTNAAPSTCPPQRPTADRGIIGREA